MATEKQIGFCASCFASEEDGSWGHTVTAVGGYCLNCGAGGVVALPTWAIKEIRRNAAWVGARYYPDDATKDERAELLALRKAIGNWPGRTATHFQIEEAGPVRWCLRQDCMDKRRGVYVQCWTNALPGETAEQAIARTADMLPWAGG